MGNAKHARERARLLREIADEVRHTHALIGRERLSARVMTAMAKVPRHEFVEAADVDAAYDDRPQGIGHGQTISQPYMVAVMTDLLDLDPAARVLEIGAGSGYQAAVLAEVASHVSSLEVIPQLAASARQRLVRLGYANVTVRHGDGFAGWREEAPFDAVMVTAAPSAIPRALVDQLKPGGRMVIPIGRPHETQVLYRCTKDTNGILSKETMLPVAFVPMVAGTD